MAHHRPRLLTRHQQPQPHAAISPGVPALNEHGQCIRHTGGVGSWGGRRFTNGSNAFMARREATRPGHVHASIRPEGMKGWVPLWCARAPVLELPGILDHVVNEARERREAMRQLAGLRRRMEAAEGALTDALAALKRAEEVFDAASDRFNAAERALDEAREDRAQARRDRYAARQAYERASATADRLARRVRETSERLDRAAELAATLQLCPGGPITIIRAAHRRLTSFCWVSGVVATCRSAAWAVAGPSAGPDGHAGQSPRIRSAALGMRSVCTSAMGREERNNGAYWLPPGCTGFARLDSICRAAGAEHGAGPRPAARTMITRSGRLVWSLG